MIFVSCISFIFYATSSSISEAIILLIIKDMEGANNLRRGTSGEAAVANCRLSKCMQMMRARWSTSAPFYNSTGS